MVVAAADSTASPSRRHQSVADRCRLLLSSHRDEGIDELASKPDFHSLNAPTWRAKDVGVLERHLWDPSMESLLRLWGVGLHKEPVSKINSVGFLPRLGTQAMHKTLVMLWLYLVFLSS